MKKSIENKCCYYDSLFDRSNKIGEYDINIITSKFKVYLGELEPDNRKTVHQWFYIIMLHHASTAEEISKSTIIYNPKIIPSTDGCNSLIYTLSNVPEVLQKILVIYMLDCMGISHDL